MSRVSILIIYIITLSTSVALAAESDMLHQCSICEFSSCFQPSQGVEEVAIADIIEDVNMAESEEVKKRKLFFNNVFDRGVNRNPYAYRGEFVAGVTAAHANLDSSNSELLLLLNDISAGGYYTSVNPYIGYTIRDNQVIGARFGFTRMGGNIDSATLDLGESNDITLDIPYISYTSDSFKYGVFFRSYAGLDSRGRFALFADVDLSYKRSKSLFEMDMGSESLFTRSQSWGIDLDFNPGVGVYIFSNVSATLSFGLGGLSYGSATQYDREDIYIGDFEDSKLSLKFNILAISIGINIHLWSYE
ncbi:MAG: hypothetical protein SNJ33_05650 [Rikenellaceae bacterium]